MKIMTWNVDWFRNGKHSGKHDGAYLETDIQDDVKQQIEKKVQDFLQKDTFNKLGYKTKINTHTTSCINLFLDIYLYSEYRLIYC